MTEPTPPSRRRGLRFGTKLVLILASLIAALQVAGWLTVRGAIERSVEQQLDDSLQVGVRVWERLHEAKERQRVEQVAVLAEDFGFREAVATRHGPTLESVLESASQRIGAPYGLVLDPEGRVLAKRVPAGAALPAPALAGLIAQARERGFSAGVVALAGDAMSYALVPVFAPDLVGWLAMGQPFATAEVEELRAVTGLRPGVVIALDGDWSVLQGDRSLGADARARLDSGGGAIPLPTKGDGGEPAIALRLSDPGTTPIYLVLTAERERARSPYAALQAQVLWLSLGAALVAMAAAFVVGRRVSGPVDALARAATRIHHGDYRTPLAVAGTDEFASLAEAFNAMQQGIAEREAHILYQAGHDALTALPNRERALAVLEQRLSDGALQGGALAVLDLRHFREVNDLLGPAQGDLALVDVARRLGEVVRGDDLVARLGGDEFLVGLWGAEAAAARQRIEGIVQAIEAAMTVAGTPLQLKADVGWVPFSREASGRLPDARTLLRRAEIALDLAKGEGSTIAAYREGLDEQHLRQLAIVGALRGAIDEGQFTLAYQPKVQIPTREVHHVEALLRWTHPELGRIGPDEFIPLAERTGLVGALTTWVVERACADMAAWQQAGHAPGVAINLSAIDLLDAGLSGRILAAIARHGVAADRIIIEVTESAVLADLDRAIATLEALRKAGVRVSVDDFGTGQSSLAQLKRLPADELKIDKSFVLQLVPGGDDERIVESIIRLGHALGLKVVAEGVETEEGLGVLARLSCDVAQGYHFSRPLPVEALPDWLAAHHASLAGVSR